jgi:hypothetical protein
VAADAAFLDAKSQLQRHLLEADLDGDKARTRLELAVAACAVKRASYADALGEAQAQIADTEQRIAAECAAADRKAASEDLARKLDAIERALPDHLEAARRLALDAIHHHFETTQTAALVDRSSENHTIKVAARRANQQKPVQSSRKKYFCFSEMQISLLIRASHPIEGRFAIVTSVAVGCGGRGLRNGRVCMRRTAKSCGPDAPTLASSP